MDKTKIVMELQIYIYFRYTLVNETIFSRRHDSLLLKELIELIV